MARAGAALCLLEVQEKGESHIFGSTSGLKLQGPMGTRNPQPDPDLALLCRIPVVPTKTRGQVVTVPRAALCHLSQCMPLLPPNRHTCCMKSHRAYLKGRQWKQK